MVDIKKDCTRYTQEEIRKMSIFRRLLLKIRIGLLLCYYSCKVWLLLQLIRFRGIFDPEMKKQYIVAAYKYRKSKER